MNVETEQTKGEITELLARFGVTMTAQFVPQSLSRNSTEKTKTLNWRVTFTRPISQLPSVKEAESFALDYQQGIGHVPGGWKEPRTLYDERANGKPWETGVYAPYDAKTASYSAYRTKKLPPPHVADILHCITLDASCMESCFEDWCADLGYDADSRKAESIYNACRKEASDARRVLGSELLRQAADMLQNY